MFFLLGGGHFLWVHSTEEYENDVKYNLLAHKYVIPDLQKELILKGGFQ